jgi:hypothetical protein
MISGVVCLAAYLLSTPLAPLGTAFLAWIDGEHRVELVNGDHGSRVVLAHDSQDMRRASGHHHCLASAALVLFAPPLSDTQPDHVLSFQAGISSAVWERLPVLASPSYGVVTAPLYTITLRDLATVYLASLCRPESPPDPSALTVFRSTVFLI